jgi:hypothetical protein
MTAKKDTEAKLSRRLATMVRPAMGRRVDAFLRQMAERAGGEYTESDAVRALLQAALDGLKVQDPG